MVEENKSISEEDRKKMEDAINQAEAVEELEGQDGSMELPDDILDSFGQSKSELDVASEIMYPTFHWYDKDAELQFQRLQMIGDLDPVTIVRLSVMDVLRRRSADSEEAHRDPIAQFSESYYRHTIAKRRLGRVEMGEIVVGRKREEDRGRGDLEA